MGKWREIRGRKSPFLSFGSSEDFDRSDTQPRLFGKNEWESVLVTGKIEDFYAVKLLEKLPKRPNLGNYLNPPKNWAKFIVTFWQITILKNSLKCKKQPFGPKIFLVPGNFLIYCFLVPEKAQSNSWQNKKLRARWEYSRATEVCLNIYFKSLFKQGISATNIAIQFLQHTPHTCP